MTTDLIEQGNAFPVGSIIMYNGNDWMDNSTVIGWYKCDGNNGTPDLINKFVKGGDSPGETGGANSKTLSSSNIPSHSHSFSGSTNSTGAHRHGVYPHAGEVQYGSGTSGAHGGDNGTQVRNGLTSSAGNHSHSVSGSTSAYGSGSAFDNQPAFYKLIFIMRVT